METKKEFIKTIKFLLLQKNEKQNIKEKNFITFF